MPYNGAPPKPDDERQRANAPIYEKMQLTWDGIRRGPELPEDVPFEWCPRTKMWWDMWRDSAQAMVMIDTDWENFLETAMIHNALWSHPNTAGQMTQLAGELRRRIESYGGTWEARRKLRMELDLPASPNSHLSSVDDESWKLIDYKAKVRETTD